MNNILSVLILNRNHADNVLQLYKALKKQTFQDFHVITIDDNSDAHGLKKLLDLKDDKFFVYSYPVPWKFGNDNKFNFGLRKSFEKKSKYTYCLQTDMKINSMDLLQKLVEQMESNPQCGAACPTLYNGNGEMTWGPGIEKVRMGKTYNINESVIFRNHLMKEMGYVNEKLIYYGSEFFYNNWFHLNNYYTSPVAGVSVTHYGGGTSKKHQNYKDYYRPRTSILIMKLFCKNDTLFKKLLYFYWETSEPRGKMKMYIKNFKIFSLIKTLIIFTSGTLVGLAKKIELE